jgi:hypothetical protein
MFLDQIIRNYSKINFSLQKLPKRMCLSLENTEKSDTPGYLPQFFSKLSSGLCQTRPNFQKVIKDSKLA